MKISEIILKLEGVKQDFGDIEVFTYQIDPDYCALKVESIYVKKMTDIWPKVTTYNIAVISYKMNKYENPIR